MRKIKVGVIGLGMIGPIHIEALRRLGFIDVVALADNNEEVAQKKAAELCIDKVYSDFNDLINDPEVESVHICTPNSLHYPMAKAVIAAGKHVVCDKPLAISSEQGAELIQLAKEKGVVAAMNFNMRRYPLIEQVRQMIANGDLGEIFRHQRLLSAGLAPEGDGL